MTTDQPLPKNSNFCTFIPCPNVLTLLHVLDALTACYYFPLSFSASLAAAPEKMAALSTDASNTIFFEFQPKSLRAKVLSAQLFVYVRKPPSSSRGQTLLLVYKVCKNRFNFLLHVCSVKGNDKRPSMIEWIIGKIEDNKHGWTEWFIYVHKPPDRIYLKS